jgi:protein-S-isoprenylcysteine O-methyltransferase Ste14
LMILEEERYLIKVQGGAYKNYQSKTERYFFGV